MSNPVGTKSKFTAAELDGKKVEFDINSSGGQISGRGKFMARPLPGGLLVIQIAVMLPLSFYSAEEFRISVPQEGVDAIEPHPNPATAAFQLNFG